MINTSEPQVSPIRAGVPEHFCLFLKVASAAKLSKQKCSRNTSKTTWSAGSTGPKKKDCPSRKGKTSSWSTGVQWSHHGPLLCSMTPLACQQMPPQYLWKLKSSIVVGQSSFGGTFVETQYITTVNSTRFVPLVMFLVVNLFFFHRIRVMKNHCPGMNASSSKASEQSELSLGSE